MRSLLEAFVHIGESKTIAISTVAVLGTHHIHHISTCKCGIGICTDSLMPNGILAALAIHDIAELTACHLLWCHAGGLSAIGGSTVVKGHARAPACQAGCLNHDGG